MHSLIFDAIGTRWQIDVASEIPKDKGYFLEGIIRERVELFDKTYSRFRRDSDVWKMSLKKGRYELPTDAAPMLSLYHDLFRLTDGRFTPLIGQVLADAGYDDVYSFVFKKIRRPLSWDEALSCESGYLFLRQPVLLDFGACGKGYLIDIVGDILEENGVGSYCVDAGGDIRVRGEGEALRVGLENPYDCRQVIGVAYLGNKSICGSAGNRRRWGDYHHIIDPFSLTSVESISAVWVVAETTMLADALATCLFFVAPERLLKHYVFEYIIMYRDYSIRKSEGFEGEFFLKS
jgi:thiamine biosynthesis lipoprotein